MKTAPQEIAPSKGFWDALAPHHAAIENNFLDLPSLRRIMPSLQPPVLVVGAGQGLLVGELRNKGIECDGVDLSPEMIRYAKLRRGLSLVHADAKSMPFQNGTYATILYATGVIDFIGDEEEIRKILNEGRRIVKPSGEMIIAFYRVSDALESFLTKVELLKGGIVCQRESLKMCLLNPVQMMAWVANHARVGPFGAMTMLLGMSMRSTLQEKTRSFRVQKIFRNQENARALIDAAPEKQPYRNEAAIKELFTRLSVPLKQLRVLSSCYIVHI
jgi:ubiquinone/menaquinone biosynthesis C-methylase UbiE